MVYFMQAGHRGPYKIGVSEQPEVRRRQVERQFDNIYVALVVVLPGSYDEERLLHEHFSVGRLKGEWFLPGTPGLHDFISSGLTFEAMWPEDTESRCLLELLDVLVPDPKLRREWTEACKAIVATDPDESWNFPAPSERARWSRFLPYAPSLRSWETA